MDMNERLQQAIIIAGSGLPAVISKAFKQDPAGLWKPRRKCLTEFYSSGEAVVCAVLLCIYMELNSDWLVLVDVPEDKEYNNRVTDLIWPGGYYFVDALNRLSNDKAWEAIQGFLPGGR